VRDFAQNLRQWPHPTVLEARMTTFCGLNLNKINILRQPEKTVVEPQMLN
jgi:hypothetical protein